MQKLKQLYRSNYSGEGVIKSLTYENQTWTPEVEHVPNSVFNTHTTTQAAVIGNGESRLQFNLNLVLNHYAGLGGANSLQTYGCNALYRDYNPDFLIAVGKEIIHEIDLSGYADRNIVYVNADYLLDYPGKFYLIPQNLYFDAGAIAAYMAAFDGHKKIFLLGFDSYDAKGPVNNVYKNTPGYLTSDVHQDSTFFTRSLHAVMRCYSDVEFVRVMPTNTWWKADEHDALPNFRQINYNEFVLEADVGVLAPN
jgi:hypothetical protein